MRTIHISLAVLAALLLSLDCSAVEQSGDTVDVDTSEITEGECLGVVWHELPVFVCKLSPNQIDRTIDIPYKELGDPSGKEIIKSMSRLAQTRGSYFASRVFAMQQSIARSPTRSLRSDISVVILISPYNGCTPNRSPIETPEGYTGKWWGGFYNPCLGEAYDLFGHVLVGHSLGNNWDLYIPPHKFLTESQIRLGELPDTVNFIEYDFSADLYSKYYSLEQRLFFAAMWDARELTMELLKEGVDPNQILIAGNSPLHAAILFQNPRVAKILLENGAKPDIRNRVGKEPVDLAEFLKNEELVELLSMYKRKTKSNKAPKPTQ